MAIELEFPDYDTWKCPHCGARPQTKPCEAWMDHWNQDSRDRKRDKDKQSLDAWHPHFELGGFHKR